MRVVYMCRHLCVCVRAGVTIVRENESNIEQRKTYALEPSLLTLQQKNEILHIGPRWSNAIAVNSAAPEGAEWKFIFKIILVIDVK